MNPYESSPAPSEGPPQPAGQGSGRPCPDCGGTTMRKDYLSSTRPSVLYFLLFGWLFLLIRAAFSKRRDVCADCGATTRYKTMGSILAMVALLTLVILTVISALAST